MSFCTEWATMRKTTMNRRSAPESETNKTVQHRVAFRLCEIANGTCPCKGTPRACCNQMYFHAGAIIRLVRGV
jgi:hypothetical protein